MYLDTWTKAQKYKFAFELAKIFRNLKKGFFPKLKYRCPPPTLESSDFKISCSFEKRNNIKEYFERVIFL
jgi:hypothetical protein